MDIHKNARSCLASRALLVRRVTEEGWTVKRAAEAQGLSERAAYGWLARYRAAGASGLLDRSSRPHRMPSATPEHTKARIVALRRQRLTGSEIGARLGVPRSTVARILQRSGLGRLRSLEPPEPVRRYEKQLAGELLHLDIKKLGRIGTIGHRITGDYRQRARGGGWEFVHVCIDDHSRLAYAEILPDERQDSAIAFLRRAVAWFAGKGIKARAILTDNGSCYVAKRFVATCQQLGLRVRRTRPYRPQTNGKAERFIQTLLREWAYRWIYSRSHQRAQRLPLYLHFYNFHRQHMSLGNKPPISRLPLLNNLMGIHT
jgi:transposase InsO family protein